VPVAVTLAIAGRHAHAVVSGRRTRAVVEAGAASPRARALIEDGAARGAASARARWSRPEQYHRARALIEDGAARGAASGRLQQEPQGGRYQSRASLRRDERSLRPPAAGAARGGDRAADARRKLHNCQSCTLYAGAEGLEQSDR
jgi:hypothetical protein